MIYSLSVTFKTLAPPPPSIAAYVIMEGPQGGNYNYTSKLMYPKYSSK